MKEQIQVLVQTKQSYERLTAIIDMYLTNDPQAPLEIKIFSWDNMLLLFNSKITPYMIAEMCSKLLMANMKPEKLPYLLYKLIQTAYGTSRAFYLAAEDQQTFYLQVTDFCDDYQFPRFSLPVRRCDFEEVARELYTHLRAYRQYVAELNAKLADSQRYFDAQHQDLISYLQKQTTFGVQLQYEYNQCKTALEAEKQQTNAQLLGLNQRLAVRDVENAAQAAYVAQLTQESASSKQQIASLIENLHKTELELYQTALGFTSTQQQLYENSKALEMLQTKYEAKVLQLKDAEAQALQLSAQLAYATSSMDSNYLRAQQDLTELKQRSATLYQENEDLKVLAGKLASKVEDLTEKELFYQGQIQYLSEQNQQAIAAIYDLAAKNDAYYYENTQQKQLVQDYQKRLTDATEELQQHAYQHETQKQQLTGLEGENYALKRYLKQEKQRADDAEAYLGNQMYGKIIGQDRLKYASAAEPRLQKTGVKSETLDGSSILSYYRGLLQESHQESQQTSYQPSFRQFDMSKYLRDLAAPRPARAGVTSASNAESAKHTESAISARSASGTEGASSTLSQAIQLSPSPKSSLSAETKNIVNKYVKNQIYPKDLEMQVSSTSEDLFFRVLDTVPQAPGPQRPAVQASEILREISNGEQPTQIKADSQLKYYMDLLNAEIE